MNAVDVYGFAGGFTLGVVQAGFKLVAKREMPSGFGVPLCEENRKLLGSGWQVQCDLPSQWEPVTQPDLLFGNPPCSGFSVMNRSTNRGADSTINACMHEFFAYAETCRPTVLIMESVQQAYRQGRELMTSLRTKLERGTKCRYDLTHVLHSCAACGGYQRRHRYFLVCSRIPFHVEPPFGDDCLPVVPPASVVVSDLVDTALGDVEGHLTVDLDRHANAKRAVALANTGNWKPGTNYEQAVTRAFDAGVDLAATCGLTKYKIVKAVLYSRGWQYTQRRMHPDKPFGAITGAALTNTIHWAHPRTLTHREVARAMGFPDDWACTPAVEHDDGHKWWGKGVTVQAGRWIASCARNSLDNANTKPSGELVGDRERLVDVTTRYIINKPVDDASDDEE